MVPVPAAQKCKTRLAMYVPATHRPTLQVHVALAMCSASAALMQILATFILK